MARSSLHVVPFCFVLLVAWAEEDERLWNTPPELIPEQVIQEPDAKNGRSLSIPITANINLNTGNNAHSLGFQVGPGGISYSESNSFNHAAISESQSVSFAAGSAGVSGAVAQAVGQHHLVHQGNVNSQGFGVGNAVASSSGVVGIGHVASAAASSAGSTHSSASSTAANAGHSQGTNIRFPGQSHHTQLTWTNVHSNHNTNGQDPSRVPKLEIEFKPQREQSRRPIRLDISTHQSRWENRQPTIHIHNWHPTYRPYYDDVK
ncbi:uncharacterized protein LOC143378862 isoform X2 [Andrena cerasifolii]|uniref:uncharacterized protein LOC143378862 isoform X2 n=1 Tax=Andrena cerasifolii TaxID=2819439 RepID=UPI004037CA40